MLKKSAILILGVTALAGLGAGPQEKPGSSPKAKGPAGMVKIP